MIAEEAEGDLKPRLAGRHLWSWLNLVATLLLLGAGLWYLFSKVSLPDLVSALKLARLPYIVLSVVVMIFTLPAKSLRWRTLLSPRKPLPSIRTLFWAIVLGQYVNLLIPLLRLGEFARVYALNQQVDIRMTRALSTLVVEKTLDLVMLGFMSVILLSTVVLPDFPANPSMALGLFAGMALIIFYLLAYQTERLLNLLQKIAERLPALLGRQIVKLGASGLEGLAALKGKRTLTILLGQSALIALLSLSTPWMLFFALNIPMGPAEATLIHVVVTLALVPPTTPGKLVVFDGTVAFLLKQLGLEDGAVIAAYTIVYHLVILLPQIVLGSVSSSRTNWRWRRTAHKGESKPAGITR